MTFQTRRFDATLATASVNATKQQATARLLEALSANEGDSTLGLLADAILRSGPFYVRNRDECNDAENACADLTLYAETLSEAHEQAIDYAMNA